VRRRSSQSAWVSAGLSGALCLFAAGGLVGLCVRGGLPAETSEAIGSAGAGPLLAMLGFFPLLLLVRFAPTGRAGIGGAIWGVGAAVMAAGSDPAMWLAFIAGPALFALLGSWLTRRIGFHALVIAVLWMLIELAMIASGLAPRGMLASMAEHSVLFSGVAAWLGSVHVALLLALVTAGVVRVAAGCIRAARRQWPSYPALRCRLRPVDIRIPWHDQCGMIVRPRAPPMRS